MDLGSVRSAKVKKIAREILRRYPDKFTADFEETKKLIASLLSAPSKSLRNTITGYVTHLVVLSQSRAEDEYSRY
jgi:small subunit ribosomal protein S17e